MKSYLLAFLIIIVILFVGIYFQPTGFVVQEPNPQESDNEIVVRIIHEIRDNQLSIVPMEPETQKPAQSQENIGAKIVATEDEPEPDLCAGVTCQEGRNACPDGFEASCTNSCIQSTGKCSSCTPDCSGHDIEETQQPQLALSHIVFSQVYYESQANHTTEWIELYNPGEQEDISGWSIHDNADSNTYTFPQGIFIKKTSFLVVVRSSDDFRGLFQCQYFHDTWKNNSILNNGGDQLTLKDNDGNDVDFVAWEKGHESAYPEWEISAGKGKSIVRKPETDTGSPSDWLGEQDPSPHCQG